ncbi:hypothetical protein [Okeania sp. KiyG1]|nr:hypothetical protein [Okeania sp. KiyG1]
MRLKFSETYQSDRSTVVLPVHPIGSNENIQATANLATKQKLSLM